MRIFFNIIYFLIFPFFAVMMLIKGKWHAGMKDRLGLSARWKQKLQDKPRIWIHAVSAGEVLAVVDLIKRLGRQYPGHQIICSTVTSTGFELASASLKDSATVIFAPIDFSWVTRRYVDAIRPVIYLSAETELWPNLYGSLKRRKVPVLLINGRISDASFQNYKRLKFLFKPALDSVRMFAMQTQEDARRIRAIGADPVKIYVVGNLKFDTVSAAVESPDARWKEHTIFLAGSTHPGEEEIVIDAFQELKASIPEARLMIAPRHIERAEAVMDLLRRRGLEGLKLSAFEGQWPENTAIVVDQMGRLRYLYQSAAMVFVGKTFKVGGGQNMIEPLVFGKPTFIGPMASNFKDAVNIFLKAGVLVQLQRPADLAPAIRDVIRDPARREHIRLKAPEVIRDHQGATERLLTMVKQWL